jgi:uncharacterized protein (DUF58 family)
VTLFKAARSRLRPRERPQAKRLPPAPGVAEVVTPELPPALLRRLEFTVVRRLDGFLFGDYRGLFYGPSLDLAEVREYQPGDEVRRMDWNVTARMDRLHVRQYREERELTAWLLVDLSPSMWFGTKRRLKREVALDFAGTAALIVTRHGDKVGVLSTGSGPLLPPRTGRIQALNVLGALGAQRQEGASEPLGSALERLDRTLRRRSLIFVVSDFLDPGTEPAWGKPLGRLATRHEVIAVRVFDPAERELPDAGGLSVRDPETGREVWVDLSDRKLRAEYRTQALARDAAARHALRAAQVDLLDLATTDDIVAPLLRFTTWRRTLR